MSQMKGSKNVSKMAFFLLPLGIAVNFIGGQVATLLNLPIYLDAIGTMVVAALCVVPAFASSAGNVADAVEQTWTDAAGQIKTVVDTVVFPALTMVLGIAFFVKVALCFFDYRKHGQFEWTGAAILFVCLIFVLLAPNYIWNIVGI